MSKKIILLALAVASLAVFALPAMAVAAEEDTPNHLETKPEGSKVVEGVGSATLTGALAQNITCPVSSGTATFTSTTTGTFQQVFGSEAKPCTNPSSKKCTTAGQPAGVIKTELLEFHLLTVVDSITKATGPGILVTPNAEKFASFTCEGGLLTSVTGNGLVGTTDPCNTVTSEPTVTFSSSSNTVQTHKTVVATETPSNVEKHTTTEYALKAFGAAASEDAVGKIKLVNSNKLICT